MAGKYDSVAVADVISDGLEGLVCKEMGKASSKNNKDPLFYEKLLKEGARIDNFVFYQALERVTSDMPNINVGKIKKSIEVYNLEGDVYVVCPNEDTSKKMNSIMQYFEKAATATGNRGAASSFARENNGSPYVFNESNLKNSLVNFIGKDPNISKEEREDEEYLVKCSSFVVRDGRLNVISPNPVFRRELKKYDNRIKEITDMKVVYTARKDEGECNASLSDTHNKEGECRTKSGLEDGICRTGNHVQLTTDENYDIEVVGSKGKLKRSLEYYFEKYKFLDDASHNGRSGSGTIIHAGNREFYKTLGGILGDIQNGVERESPLIIKGIPGNGKSHGLNEFLCALDILKVPTISYSMDTFVKSITSERFGGYGLSAKQAWLKVAAEDAKVVVLDQIQQMINSNHKSHRSGTQEALYGFLEEAMKRGAYVVMSFTDHGNLHFDNVMKFLQSDDADKFGRRGKYDFASRIENFDDVKVGGIPYSQYGEVLAMLSGNRKLLLDDYGKIDSNLVNAFIAADYGTTSSVRRTSRGLERVLNRCELNNYRIGPELIMDTLANKKAKDLFRKEGREFIERVSRKYIKGHADDFYKDIMQGISIFDSWNIGKGSEILIDGAGVGKFKSNKKAQDFVPGEFSTGGKSSRQLSFFDIDTPDNVLTKEEKETIRDAFIQFGTGAISLKNPALNRELHEIHKALKRYDDGDIFIKEGLEFTGTSEEAIDELVKKFRESHG